MNAHKFVAEKGIDEAKRVLELASDAWAYDAEQDCFFDGSDLQDGYSIEHCNGCFLVEELKQVVESVELIDSYGGITKAKSLCNCFSNACKSAGVKTSPRLLVLQKAIADYELVESYKQVRCEVLDMVDVSPNCKKIGD